MERFGVPPSKVIEVQALIGDSTDNVPGVPGIGVKTAALLINEFGDLDTLLARASEITQKKRRESLIPYADQARLSRTLVILDCQRSPGRADRRDRRASARRRDADQLPAQARIQHAASPHRRRPRRRSRRKAKRRRRSSRASAARPTTIPCARCRRENSSRTAHDRDTAGETEVAGPARGQAREPSSPASLRPRAYETVTELSRLSDAARRRARSRPFRLPRQAELVRPHAGRAGRRRACARAGTCLYVPLAHRAGEGLDLGGEAAVPQIRCATALDLLKPLLEDESVLKIVQNAKFDMVALSRYGIALKASTIPASCPMRSMQAAPSICPSSLPALSSATPASPRKR